MLSEAVNFDFKSEVRNLICLSKIFIYLTSKKAEGRYFIKQLLNAMSFLINKLFYTIGNMACQQDFCIPMGIDSPAF